MYNIFDEMFQGYDMYRGWVIPELYPKEPQPRLENWSPDDLESYCGGAYVYKVDR